MNRYMIATFLLSTSALAGPYDLVVRNDYGSVTSTVTVLTVLGLDFGDAPQPPYPTLLSADGARHVLVPGVHLGQLAGAEPDGQPDANANGDVSAADEEDLGGGARHRLKVVVAAVDEKLQEAVRGWSRRDRPPRPVARARPLRAPSGRQTCRFPVNQSTSTTSRMMPRGDQPTAP